MDICIFGGINSASMKMRLIIPVLFGLIFTGCTINSNLMLQTDKGYEFDEIPKEPQLEYEISKDDRVNFQLYANNGFQLVNVTPTAGRRGGGGGGASRRGGRGRRGLEYRVEPDGRVKLPVLGKTPITGQTVREAEQMLEEKYSEFYNDPFVLLEVTNKRVMVFPGSGGDASVVTLKNDNTTVLEVLAMVGGISTDGKAKKIKLIRRKDNGERKVFKMDLSRIEGLKYGEMVVQANDIIYVEPAKRIASEILRDITPVISLASSTLFVFATLKEL